MTRLFSGRSKKSGFAPGEMLYTGDMQKSETKIHIMQYNDKELFENDQTTINQCFDVANKHVTWIDIDNISNVDLIGKIGKCLNLNPLTVEDILTVNQRPKCEHFKDYIYVVMNMLRYDEKEKKITKEQLSIILSKNIVITFQDGIEGDVFDKLKIRIRKDKGTVRQEEADFLFYSLIDAVVDEYFVVLEGVNDSMETVEKDLIGKGNNLLVYSIQKLKQELVELRKEIWPVREVLIELERSKALVSRKTKMYLRDVYDHIVQIVDTIEILRDILSEMFDIHLSNINNKTNEVMKFLTVIMTLFMPLTFLTGIYGMNFEFMPGLNNPLGFYLLLFFMTMIVIAMFIFFKMKKLI